MPTGYMSMKIQYQYHSILCHTVSNDETTKTMVTRKNIPILHNILNIHFIGAYFREETYYVQDTVKHI